MFFKKLAIVLAILIHYGGLCDRSDAGAISSSTVNQNGQKFGFPGPGQNIDDPNLEGSASRIGIFDFDFPADPSLFNFLKAKIRFWVQLPIAAEGDAAPWIVFAKAGTRDAKELLLSLSSGDAVRTDIRISYNMPDRGPGVMQKTMIEFESLTTQQGLALSSILSADPNNRLEAWLVSDSLTAITVPQNGEVLSSENGMLVTTLVPFTATLDLLYVPEPSTFLIFSLISLGFINRQRVFKTERNSAVCDYFRTGEK